MCLTLCSRQAIEASEQAAGSMLAIAGMDSNKAYDCACCLLVPEE